MSSTQRMMRDGLFHKRPGTTDEEFFALIDATGGWPPGFQHVGFEHSESRAAGFCRSARNDGWWTVVASADDYYLWKLSPAMLQRIVDSAISAARLTGVSASSLFIKNSQGYNAARAAAEGAA